MARFCSNCGRALQEGEVCNCRQVNMGTGQATGQANGQQNKGISLFLETTVQKLLTAGTLVRCQRKQ